MLKQDKYVAHLEQKRRQDQGILLDYAERMKKEEQAQDSLQESITELQEELNRREEKRRAEVAKLKDKVAEVENEHCYLKSRVLGLQQDLDDLKAANNRRTNKERTKGLDMLKLQSRNKALP
jgi:predicted nuclease with TOPRIM domain